MRLADGPFRGTDRFRLVRRLGSGGMGVVYEVYDRERHCRVALKTVKDLAGNDLLRLKNEFRALQDLQHRNIVSLGELCEDGGQWFFTMELVDGVNFLRFVQREAPLRFEDPGPVDSISGVEPTLRPSPAQQLWDAAVEGPTEPTYDEGRLRAALGQLVGGLAAAHAAGKVHRDIKPSNILVTPEGRVVILDFGLVTGATEQEQSTAAHPVGTVEFMAPELAASRPVGTPADMYSVGVVLFQALTSRLPFTGAPLDVMLRKQTTDPPPPSTLCSRVPKDLDELCQELLQFDPGRRPTAAALLGRLGETSDSSDSMPGASLAYLAPFVGRADELRMLANAFEDTRHGGAVTVLVTGESGVGKSALVRRFVEKVATQGAVVLAGRCFERETVPYKAVDGVIDALSHYMARLPTEESAALLPRQAGLLGDVFPVLRRVKPLAMAPRLHAETQLDPLELRTRLFAATRELIGRLADRRPLVLVIDDLQWADGDSLALIAEVLRPPEAPAVLAIATQRTGLGADAGGTSEASRTLPGDLRRVRLGPLPPGDARDLAETLLHRATLGRPADPEVIAAEAGGHPLFIDELVRHVTTHEGATPPALRLDDALRYRVARLAPAMRRILELVAVAGIPLAQEVIARAAGLEPAPFAREIAYLRVANLVQTTGGRATDTVSPYHDRVREAVLAHLEPGTRRSCHAELALALEASGQADPEVLAVHWRGAGEPERAAVHALNAAEAAAKAFAFDHAAALYRRVLELRPATHPSCLELRVTLGETLENAGRGGEAADAYLLAADEAPPVAALDLQRRAAEQLLRSGHVDQGLAAVRAVLAAVGLSLPRTPRRALASVLLRRALVRLRGLRFRERHASQISPEILTRIDICWAVAHALGTIDAIRGNDFSGRLLLMALRAGEPRRLVHALGVEAVFSSLTGGRSRRRPDTILGVMRELAARVDDHPSHAYVELTAGLTDYYYGRFPEVVDHLTRCESILREHCHGATWELDSAWLWLVFAMTYLGRIADISRLVPRLAAEALDRGDLYCATNLRLSFPNAAWLVDDDVAEARRVAAEAAGWWSRDGFQVQHWYELTSRAQNGLYAGEARATHDWIAGRWPALAGSMLLRVQIVRVEAHQWRASCALAAAAAAGPGAEHDRLVAQAERDARRILRERMHYATPLGQLLLAAVAHRRGEAERAVQKLTAAVRGFDAAGMALYRAVARRRLGLVLAGDEGRRLVDEADAWMAGQRIKRPSRWTAMLAPGFAD